MESLKIRKKDGVTAVEAEGEEEDGMDGCHRKHRQRKRRKLASRFNDYS